MFKTYMCVLVSTMCESRLVHTLQKVKSGFGDTQVSIPTSLLGQVDPISALRCGFASLQPISVKKTVQKLGLKITSIHWHFESGERDSDFIGNYPSYMRLLNDFAMQKIKLPSRIDQIVLSDMLTRSAVEHFNKDHELKSILGKVEGEKDSSRPFLELVRVLRKRYEEKRPESMLAKTEMFAHSNLPFSFFTDLVMFSEAFDGFLDAMQRKTGLYEAVWLHKYANNSRLFHLKFEEMKNSLIPLFDAAEHSSFLQRCLSIFVAASNCESVDSLPSLEFIDIKKVDSEQFTGLSNEFRNSLDNYVSTILSIEPTAFSQIPATDMKKVFSQMLVQ